MSANTKSILVSIACYAISAVVISLVLKHFFEMNSSFATLISMIVAVLVFTPTRNVIVTNEGNEYHLRWRFLSKTVFFK